jgi:hypothetical protein
MDLGVVFEHLIGHPAFFEALQPFVPAAPKNGTMLALSCQRE